MKPGLIIIFAILAQSMVGASEFRGNTNISYQGNESGPNTAVSTFGQILNVYASDRVFFSNDFTLGAYLNHNKASNAEKGDFRVRYTLNMTGYRYSLYSSYSPYTIYRPGNESIKVRIFQASLNYRPKLLSDISSSYSSTRQFTTDKPRSRSSFSYIWNIGTQFAKPFGTFRSIYQRQRSRVEIPVAQKQLLQSVNFGYDIAKQWPRNIGWSASYNFTGTRNEIPEKVSDDSKTHIGSAQIGRSFGRWFSAAASGSGRFSDFERGRARTRIDDVITNGSLNFNPRDNISMAVLRSYSSTKTREDSVTEIINDYVNLGGALEFDVWGDNMGRFSVSRSIYYASTLGRNNVDNATLILEFPLYRNTDMTVNLGIGRNEKTPSGLGRYQMTRTIDIISRPRRLMTININYQSNKASNKINFRDSNTDNLVVNIAQTLKPYFNYAATYTHSTFRSDFKSSISVFSLAVNYRISRVLSMLNTYTRRDLGETQNSINAEIDEIITTRVTLTVSRRSSLTANYSISNINTSRQSQGYGGYFTMNF